MKLRSTFANLLKDIILQKFRTGYKYGSRYDMKHICER